MKDTVKVLASKHRNKRVYVWSNDADKFNLAFKVIDNDYKGFDKYVLHGVLRGKLVFTQISISRFSAVAIMRSLAHILGYELVKIND